MPRPSLRVPLALLAAALVATGTPSAARASGAPRPPASRPAATDRPEDGQDPLAEVRHQLQWTEVAPAPIPEGLPLLGPEGVDGAGFPRQALDWAALRSLLVNRRFAQLTAVMEQLQDRFEADPRYEQWILDAGDALGKAHEKERALIDAWIAATPRSFAPYLASARYWENTGFLWRGSKLFSETSEFELRSMDEAFDRARADARRALELRPGLQGARAVLVSTETVPRSASRARAWQVVEEALARCPSCTGIREAWLWALTPRWGGSLEEMDAFARWRIDAGNPRHRALAGVVLLERAEMARQDGREDDQLALLDQACELGGAPEFFLQRAIDRWPRGGTDAYASDLERALALAPGAPGIRQRRSWLREKQGRWEEAAEDLLYVLRAQPTSRSGAKARPRVLASIDGLGRKEHLAGREAAAARLSALAEALEPGRERIAVRARELAHPPMPPAAPASAPVSGDPNPVLTVTVRDAAGASIPGARVMVRPGTGHWAEIRAHYDGKDDQWKTADGAGRAKESVPPGTYLVMAAPAESAQPTAAAVVGVPITGAEVVITLGGATRVCSGRVVDHEGRPAVGRQVRAFPLLVAGARPIATASSGPGGLFTLRGLDAGGYALSVEGTHAFTEVGAGGPDAPVIRLPEMATLRGRALVPGPAGRLLPAEGITVQFGGRPQAFATSSAGRFTLEVNAPADGIAYVWTQGRPAVPRVVKGGKGTVELGDVVIGPGRTLEGCVTDPEGRPAPSTQIALRHGPVLGATRRDGCFTVTVASEPVELQVSPRAWPVWTRTIPADETQVRVRLTPGAIVKVLALDAAGGPIAGARVSVGGPRFVACETDATGRCELRGLSTGQYWADAKRKGPAGRPGTPPPRLLVPIPSEDEVGLRLVWSPEPTSLRIAVESPRLGDLARVHAFPGAPGFAGLFDDEGKPQRPHFVLRRATVEVLPPDRYTVVALDARDGACGLAVVQLGVGQQGGATLHLEDGSCRDAGPAERSEEARP
jgi:tetratricopeptide (TPR) repeat protein